MYTGVKVLRHRADEGQQQATRGLGLLRKVMPVSEELDGQKFFTRINARRAATPLFAALVVIEITDVIFAVDSVPAILAVSNEPYLVFASNAFAILGLRALYFLLATAKDRFHYLSHALGAILIFVGIKMSISHWVPHQHLRVAGDHHRHARRGDRVQHPRAAEVAARMSSASRHERRPERRSERPRSARRRLLRWCGCARRVRRR